MVTPAHTGEYMEYLIILIQAIIQEEFLDSLKTSITQTIQTYEKHMKHINVKSYQIPAKKSLNHDV
jgi:hypothetical protein